MIRNIPRARRHPKSDRSRTARRAFRPPVEALEDRDLLATVTWINSGGGNWDTPANWSTGQVPGPGDLADINTSTAATITIQSGDSLQVQGVSTGNNDTLSITGGSLTVTAGSSTLSGPLSMTGGSLTASGSGVSLTASGAASVDGASLLASGGATLSLPKLASYRGLGPDAALRAVGAGSVLSLPALAALTGGDPGPYGTHTQVLALAGGTASLPALARVDGRATVLEADGPGSVLDVPALAGFASTVPGDSTLQVTHGGTLKDPKLTVLDGVTLVLDGTGTLSYAQIAQFTRGDLSWSKGNLVLGGVTDADGTTLSVSGGATLSLPKLASYRGLGPDAALRAVGAGSVLSLPALAALTGGDPGPYGTHTQVLALAGGTASLPALARVDGRATVLEADGPGSVLDVSALASFASTVPGDSTLQVTNGGTLKDPKLTVLDGVTLVLDGTGTLSYAQIAQFTRGDLSWSKGNLVLGGVTDADGTTLSVSGGATLSLPKLASYRGLGPDAALRAVGAGSVLSLPALAALTGGDPGPYGTHTQVLALAGGTASLPALARVDGRATVLEADGPGSVLDVPALAGFASTVADDSTLQVTHGGTLKDPKLTVLDGVTLVLDGTGTLSYAQIAQFTRGDLSWSKGNLVLGGVTDADGTTLSVSGGATLSLPKLASYRGLGPDAALRAVGAGSVLSLPALAALTGGDPGPYGTHTQVLALAGGTASLPALARVDGRATVLEADGPGSVLDVSALASFTSTAADSTLQVTNGGTLKDSSPTRFNGVSIVLDGTNTQVGGSWASITGGSLAINGGAHVFSNLTGFAPSNLQLNGGATLSLPALLTGTLIDGESVTIRGTLVSIPAPGTSGATINVPGGPGLVLNLPISAPLTGTTFNIGAGSTINLPSGAYGGGTTFNVGANATVNLTGGQSTTIGDLLLQQGATFATSGALSSGGSITLGPASHLNVQGDFTPSAPGTLTVQVGGFPSSGLFGQITSTGTANLGGRLAVQLVNGFGKVLGGDYTILTDKDNTGDFIRPIDSPVVGGKALFVATTTPDRVYLTATANTSDLGLTGAEIHLSPNPAAPGRDVSIRYTVHNLADAPSPLNSWEDSIYLSRSATFDPASALLIGRKTHVGVVAGHGSYTETLTKPLPGVPTGNFYVFVVTDSRQFVPDPDRSNNVVAASTRLTVNVPTLTPNQTTTGTIASGQDLYYRLDLPAGASVRLTASFGAGAGGDLFVRYGDAPSTANFDASSTSVGPGTQQARLQGDLPGPYYILLHGHEEDGAGATFHLLAQILPFSITDVGPKQASNAGTTTLTVHGSEFTAKSTVALVSGGRVVHPKAVSFQDAGTLLAVFNLAGVTPGAFDVRVTEPTHGTTTDPHAFTVTPNNPGHLVVHVSVPSIVRAPYRNTVVTVDYSNDGGTDIPAPLIILTSTNARFLGPGHSVYTTGDIRLLGINPNGPLGVLPPGYHGRIEVPFVPINQGPHAQVPIQAHYLADPSLPFDWTKMAQLKGAPHPNTWETTVANARRKIGTTWGQVVAAVDSSIPSVQTIQGQPGTVPPIYYDFDNLLRYTVTAIGATVGAAPKPHLTPLVLPRAIGKHAVGSVAGVVTLYLVGPAGGTFHPGGHTYLITPGLSGGVPDPGGRYLALATSIATADPTANVLLADWSAGAPKFFYIGGAGGSGVGGLAPGIGNINPTADALFTIFKGFMTEGKFDPNNATFIGETFGDDVNSRLAAEIQGAGLGQVRDDMAFDPASELSGYYPASLVGLFRHSVAFENCLVFDTHMKIGERTVYLNLDDSDTEQGVLWLNTRIGRGDTSWLWPSFEDPKLPSIQGAAGDHWDGSVANGYTYDAKPGKISTCLAISVDVPDDPGDDEPVDDDDNGDGGDPAGKGGGDGGGGTSDNRTPNDPNDIAGPSGFGPGHFVAADQVLPYRIDFENKATATAPAQVVVVKQTLDSHLDLRTFQLGNLGFGSSIVHVPAGLSSFTTRVDARATIGLFVDITAALNPATHQVTWTFTSLDPTTLDLPSDPLAGLLPPNNASGRGEAFVSYTIQAKAGSHTGTRVNAKATVVFDVEKPLDTPTIFNTIDAGTPTSHVSKLPGVSSGTNVPLRWSGVDDKGGSGIGSFDVYVSDNGGRSAPFLLDTTATSATFRGVPGHRYSFYSIATDHVGHRQAGPVAIATTLVKNQPGQLQFGAATYPASEGQHSAVITVNRVNGTLGRVTVRVATSDGTARAGKDYLSASKTLSFGPGETSKSFVITLRNDKKADGTETVKLALSQPTGGASLGSLRSATLRIQDPPRPKIRAVGRLSASAVDAVLGSL